jgi:CubicO group peptidase (beta-lactamase class C family)
MTAVVCLAAVGALAQTPVQKIDSLVDAWAKQGRFNGSVLVAKGGQILMSKGYGLANIEQDVPNKPNTKHRLGSITKQFTAVAILQLAEQGKLKLDDPVSKYYEDAPASWAPITIHHLLTHTSGIKNYTAQPDYGPKMREKTTAKAIVDRVKDKPLDFEPGSKWSYSNTGYTLLGYIIEKVMGGSYADYLKKNVFSVADMQDSGYDSETAIIKNRATGYSVSPDGKMTNSAFIDMSVPHAAGALYSTVEDLYRWDRALLSDKLLSAKSKELMYTPVKNNYGYGWMIEDWSGHKMIGHGGGVNGFATYIARFPNDDAFVVLLGNSERAASGRLAKDVATILFGGNVEPPKERKAVQVSSAVLDRYVGRYDSPVLKFDVKNDNGALVVQTIGQGPLKVTPMAEDRFFQNQVDAEIQFVMGDGGKAKELVLYQGGGTLRAKRVE